MPVVQALFVTILWSTSWVLIKIGLEEIPAISFAGLRYGSAFLVLALVLLAMPRMRAQVTALTRADWLRLGLLGLVFYALTQGAQFIALGLVPAVTLSLMVSFSPAAVALLGASFLGERLTHRQWGGLVCFLIGATIYFLPFQIGGQRIGLLVGGLALLANASSALLGRSVNRRRHLHPLVVTTVSMGIGATLLLATGLAADGIPHLDWSGWGIVLWLAIVNTAFAFTLWNHTLQHLTAIESSLINNTMLVQIAILAWIFLDEAITPREAVGLVLAVLGVLVVQLPKRRKHTDSEDLVPGSGTSAEALD